MSDTLRPSARVADLNTYKQMVEDATVALGEKNARIAALEAALRNIAEHRIDASTPAAYARRALVTNTASAAQLGEGESK